MFLSIFINKGTQKEFLKVYAVLYNLLISSIISWVTFLVIFLFSSCPLYLLKYISSPMLILTLCIFLKNLFPLGIIPNELVMATGRTGYPDFIAILAAPVCSLIIFLPSSIVPSGNIATNLPSSRNLTELLTTRL